MRAFLGPRMYVDFSDDAQYSAKLEDLAREILARRQWSSLPSARTRSRVK